MNDQIKLFDIDTKSYITLEEVHRRLMAQAGDLPEEFDGDWDKVWERIDPQLIADYQYNEMLYRSGKEDPELLQKMNQKHDESYYAYKPVNYPIRLDFSTCKRLRDVHQLLKTAFGLPEYYGENWDALWDCLDYYFIDDVGRVEFCGLGQMDQELYRDCAPMFEIFERLRKQAPGVEFVFLS